MLDSGPGYVRCPCLELAKERKPLASKASKSSHGASEANEIHSLKSTLGTGLVWLGPEYQGSQGASHPCCFLLRDAGPRLRTPSHAKRKKNVFEPPEWEETENEVPVWEATEEPRDTKQHHRDSYSPTCPSLCPRPPQTRSSPFQSVHAVDDR